MFEGVTSVLSSVYDTASITTTSSTSVVNSIILTFIGSFFVVMQMKAKLNIECLDIDTSLLKNPSRFLKPYWLSSFNRKCF